MQNNFGLFFLFLEIKNKYNSVFINYGRIIGFLTLEEYLSFFFSEEQLKIFFELDKFIKFKKYKSDYSISPKNIFCEYNFSIQLELDKLDLYQKLGLDGFLKKYGFGQYLPLLRNPQSNECTVFIMHNDPNFSGMIMGHKWQSGIFDVLSILKNYPKDNPFTENIIFIKDDCYYGIDKNERSTNNLVSFILEHYIIKLLTFKIGGCSYQWSECGCSRPAPYPLGTMSSRIIEKYSIYPVNYPEKIYKQ